MPVPSIPLMPLFFSILKKHGFMDFAPTNSGGNPKDSPRPDGLPDARAIPQLSKQENDVLGIIRGVAPNAELPTVFPDRARSDSIFGEYIPGANIVHLMANRYEDNGRDNGDSSLTIGHELGHWIQETVPDDTGTADYERWSKTNPVRSYDSEVESQAEDYGRMFSNIRQHGSLPENAPASQKVLLDAFINAMNRKK